MAPLHVLLSQQSFLTIEITQDTIHRTPEFEPEAVNRDAQDLAMAPLNSPMDELANSPILEVVKEEVKGEIRVKEEEMQEVKLTEAIDLKPKTEKVALSTCSEPLKDKEQETCRVKEVVVKEDSRREKRLLVVRKRKLGRARKKREHQRRESPRML